MMDTQSLVDMCAVGANVVGWIVMVGVTICLVWISLALLVHVIRRPAVEVAKRRLSSNDRDSLNRANK